MIVKLELFRTLHGCGDYILTGDTRHLIYLCDLLDKIFDRDKRVTKLRVISREIREKGQIRLTEPTMLYLLEYLIKYKCAKGTKGNKLQQFFIERVIKDV